MTAPDPSHSRLWGELSSAEADEHLAQVADDRPAALQRFWDYHDLRGAPLAGVLDGTLESLLPLWDKWLWQDAADTELDEGGFERWPLPIRRTLGLNVENKPEARKLWLDDAVTAYMEHVATGLGWETCWAYPTTNPDHPLFQAPLLRFEPSGEFFRGTAGGAIWRARANPEKSRPQDLLMPTWVNDLPPADPADPVYATAPDPGLWSLEEIDHRRFAAAITFDEELGWNGYCEDFDFVEEATWAVLRTMRGVTAVREDREVVLIRNHSPDHGVIPLEHVTLRLNFWWHRRSQRAEPIS